jgi:hypothetical protein
MVSLLFILQRAVNTMKNTIDDADYLINCPPKPSDDAGFPEPVHLDTMKNTMMNNSRLIT